MIPSFDLSALSLCDLCADSDRRNSQRQQFTPVGQYKADGILELVRLHKLKIQFCPLWRVIFVVVVVLHAPTRSNNISHIHNKCAMNVSQYVWCIYLNFVQAKIYCKSDDYVGLFGSMSHIKSTRFLSMFVRLPAPRLTVCQSSGDFWSSTYHR